MSDALVSVVIPVFRGEQFIADALDTVAAQTHRDVEVIVVDDGSPDASAEIAAARPGTRVLRRPNRGVAAARNAGVDTARGTLVAFLDQDDQWHPEKLARQVAALRRQPAVGVVLTRVEAVLTPGTRRPPWFEPEWLAGDQEAFVPSTWMVRREVLDHVGPFDTSYAIAGDADWLARAKDAGVVSLRLPEPLVRWRVHGANGSYDQATMRSETLRMLRATARRQREAARAA